MRAHIFQHIWFEDSGTIAEILSERGWQITTTKFDQNDQIPPIDEIDFLVIMGGFMSVNDEKEFAWLHGEKLFIKHAIERGVKTLGICLGAQLIANALGGRVYKNAQKEIGWHKIRSFDAPFLPKEALVFHWHGETFDLPHGAKKIASSEACENQAFVIGNSVVGLQFHLETTPKLAKLLVENCRAELVDSRFIQSENEILNAPQTHYFALKKTMENLLDYLGI